MSKETEQDEKPPKCKYCGGAVCLYTSGELELNGGDPNEEYPESVQTQITIFAHVCSVCYQEQDAGIEHPRRLDAAWQEAKLLMQQTLTNSLPPEFRHRWTTGWAVDENGFANCTKCDLIRDDDGLETIYYFNLTDTVQHVSTGNAPPCSGIDKIAWWDKVEQ